MSDLEKLKELEELNRKIAKKAEYMSQLEASLNAVLEESGQQSIKVGNLEVGKNE